MTLATYNIIPYNRIFSHVYIIMLENSEKLNIRAMRLGAKIWSDKESQVVFGATISSTKEFGMLR